MKQLPLKSLAVLLIAGCAAQPGPYAIEKFWPVGTCTGTISAPAENVYMPAGDLDVGPGAPVSYVVGTTITGTASQSDITVNGTNMEAANRNHGIVKQVLISYKLSRSLGTAPKQYVTNQTIPLTGATVAVVDLISPELGQILIDGLSATPDLSDTVDVTATVEFRGEYSGDGHAFTTGSQDFPIHVYKTGDNCSPSVANIVDAPVLGDGGVPEQGCFYAGQRFVPACP